MSAEGVPSGRGSRRQSASRKNRRWSSVSYHIDDPDAAIARLIGRYEDKADSRDDLDGVSLDFGTWRFNLRKSNTEPVVRLNLESDGDAELVREKQAELAAILKG